MHHPAQAVHSLSEAEDTSRTLLATDPNVSDWHILMALDHNYQSVIALGQGQKEKAMALITTAWKDIAAHGAARITVASDVLKSMLEITSGEVAAAQNDRASMTAYGLDVLTILQPRVAASHDPRLLDPYVRASVLIGHRAEASPYLQRLKDAGYRSPMFDASLKNQPNKALNR